MAVRKKQNLVWRMAFLDMFRCKMQTACTATGGTVPESHAADMSVRCAFDRARSISRDDVIECVLWLGWHWLLALLQRFFVTDLPADEVTHTLHTATTYFSSMLLRAGVCGCHRVCGPELAICSEAHATALPPSSC